MFSNQLLYVNMTREEKRWGFEWLAIAVVCTFLHPLRSSALMEFLFHGGNLLAAILIFRTFLISSWDIPHTTLGQILRLALLGAGLAFLANLLTNDLIYYYLPKYFYYDDFGPHFYNVLKQDILTAQLGENPLLTTAAIVFFVPEGGAVEVECHAEKSAAGISSVRAAVCPAAPCFPVRQAAHRLSDH